MNFEREPKDKGSGIKKSVVTGDCRRGVTGIHRRTDISPVCNDAPPPPKHQKEDNEDEQRVESIDFGDRRIKPERAGERHEQARAQRRRKHQKVADP